MDTHVDYTNKRLATLEHIRLQTQKKSIIVLGSDVNNEINGYPKSADLSYLPFGDMKTLTYEMSQYFGELAAVVIVPEKYGKAFSSNDVRKIRQLSSAEGAMVVWDELEKDMGTANMRDLYRPDIYLEASTFSDLNPYETEFVKSEIFEKKVYLKHGLTIENDDVVIDIGANIGLFSLFAKSVAPKCAIYAFEPSREVFEILSRNVKDVTLFNQGVAGKSGKLEFTYYPGYSVISGFHTKLSDDQAVILAGEKFKENPASDDEIKKRFAGAKTYQAEVVSLSDFIKTSNLSKIDYLKIDAEKSEVEILQSLSIEDWKKIKQVVIEVHGEENRDLLLNLLTTHNLATNCDPAIELAHETIYTIYGKKNERTLS